jgi:hypothetical protein
VTGLLLAPSDFADDPHRRLLHPSVADEDLKKFQRASKPRDRTYLNGETGVVQRL